MAAKDVRTVEVAGRQVGISNPGKEYFPELGATKSDLVDYYLAVGDALLQSAGGRPALLQRFPDGAAGKSFFQKRVPPGAPEWLETTVVSTPNGTTSNALVLADTAHVLWAVNLGCLGLHLWPYRAADPAHADELRIDLDPQPGTGFDDARQAARWTRQLLEELGIDARAKTTGNRGIHVYARLEPRWDSYQVRAAAVALARELERRHPGSVTAQWWKEERGARVFVDFNQNAPHKTVFGAWFVRPRVGGQVSTPLTWDEVNAVDPEALTLRTVPDLVDRRGDPWGDMGAHPQSIEPLLALAERDTADGLPDAPWPPEYPKMPGELTRVAPSRAKAPGSKR
ncbi:MAG TPA: non-homologous end-joining DNA ligase [Acidimicrobiales bacterium]|nr:non-homologous end-joining DNA ligase [Acidimicrobiales bacterium]